MILRRKDARATVEGIAIHEATNWLEVAVYVAEDINFPFLFDHICQVFHCVNDRSDQIRRLRPDSVEVKACQVCSGIAVDHSFYIKHRNHINNIVVTYSLSFARIAEKELNHALKSKRRLHLAGMYSRCYQHGLFMLIGCQILLILLSCLIFFGPFPIYTLSISPLMYLEHLKIIDVIRYI